MPLLQKAEAIDVVTVNEDEAPVGEASSAALPSHLARHDLSARFQSLTADAFSIYNSILSLAADNSIDLIVMSRPRPFKIPEIQFGRGHPRHIQLFDASSAHHTSIGSGT